MVAAGFYIRCESEDDRRHAAQLVETGRAVPATMPSDPWKVVGYVPTVEEREARSRALEPVLAEISRRAAAEHKRNQTRPRYVPLTREQALIECRKWP